MLDFIKAIGPTALTLIIGTFWLNRHFVARANLATLIERICDALDELKDDCADYWSVDYSEGEQVKLSVLEAKIKGRIIQISLLINLIAERRRNFHSILQSHLADLADVCTGGLFESKTRKKDIGRYMKIVGVIYKIAVALLSLKILTSHIAELMDEIYMSESTHGSDCRNPQI